MNCRHLGKRKEIGMNLKKTLMLLIGLCLIMSSTVFADLYYESESVTTGAPMGGASNAQPVLIKTYNNGEAIRIERANDVSIIMLGEGKSYQLNMERKTYSEEQKNFLVDYGLTMVKAIHELVK